MQKSTRIQNLNLILRSNGDKIIINPQSNLVSIDGEVNTPGIHKFVEGKRLRYYIKMSGGFSANAEKNNVWLELPNGDSKKYTRHKIFSPKVKDGSRIVVGRKKEEEPFDRTEYAKELTSIIASLAQAVSLIVLAR